MKIDRQALLFGGIVLAVVCLVAAMVWFASLFQTSSPEDRTPVPVQDFFSSLFPFGNSTRPNVVSPNGEDTGPDGPVPQLRRVSDKPVAGFRFKSDGVLRYGERETGHMFEARTDAFPIVRISNSTLPGIHNIVWISDTTFVLQYLDENDTTRHYVASLASSTPDQFLSGRFFTGASDLSPTGSEGEVYALTRAATGLSVERASLETPQRASIFSSTLSSWKLLPTEKELFIETSPSSASGLLYRLSGGQLEKIAEGPGLMALPHPKGNFIAYSGTLGAEPALFVRDLATQETRRMPVATFAEKCTWFPFEAPLLLCAVPAEQVQLEAWYMGLFSTNDVFWLIDPITERTTLVKKLEEAGGTAIDVTAPAVSPDGRYAGFINKRDLTLWVLRLGP